jgi:hypothetical protein
MARYLETAKRYDNLPVELLALIPPEHKATGAEMIARLVNAGILGNPRACNGTIRLNYVSAVCKHLPIRCSLEEREVKPDDPTDTRTYKALVVKPKS